MRIFLTSILCSFAIIISTQNSSAQTLDVMIIENESNNQDDFNLEPFLNYQWINCKNPKTFIRSNQLFLLVYLNENDADFDMTLLKLNNLKDLNLNIQPLIIYNATEENCRNPEHVSKLISSHSIVDPMVIVNNLFFIEKMEIEDYPISFLYSNSSGAITFYDGLEEYDLISSDVEEFLGGDAKLTDPKKPEYSGLSTYSPLIGNIQNIEAAENFGWLFVSAPSDNRILVIDAQGEIIDIIGSGLKGDKDGFGVNSSFSHPTGMNWNNGTQTLYVADTHNHSIRQITLNEENKFVVSTLVDQTTILENTDDFEVYPTDVYYDDQKLHITMYGSNQLWIYDLRKESIEVVSEIINLPMNDAVTIDVMRPNFICKDKKSDLVFLNTGQNQLISQNKNNEFELNEIIFEDNKIGGMHQGAKCLAVTYPLLNQIAIYENDRLEMMIGSGKQGIKDGSIEEAQFFDPTGITSMDGIFYVVDQTNSCIRTINEKKKTVGTMRISNSNLLIEFKGSGEHQFEYLSNEILTADTKTTLELNLEIPDGYKVINHEKNKLKNLEVGLKEGINFLSEDEDLNDGRAIISINGGENATYTRMIFRVALQEKKEPKNIYYREIYTTLIFGYDPEAPAEQIISIPTE